MIDITHKITTLREATAQAIVSVSKQETIEAIHQNKVPKGNIFEMSKAAGLLAVKKTPELLPDCHPMPIEGTKVEYEVNGLNININVTVKTIYKTGVEVEAMHGASVVALNIYDMLKPIDKGIEIGNIKLLQKKGGKSDYTNQQHSDINAQVIVCSDTVSKELKEDKAGEAILEKLATHHVKNASKQVIPDEPEQIRSIVEKAKTDGVNLLIFTGGTGLSSRDVTPETLAPLFDKEVPGIAEAIRAYGQDRMPYAFLSRSVAGTIGGMLVITLPGSTNGAKESMDALFPHVLHAFKVLRGERHD
ncbi:bifunctional molybdenum cofactor biosynthesis protein MoaC/MoaB [Parvicella tangerina]|uniref:Molybdopterin adenylyltransferase n=1 Tax=Parvicella tangerina TaxID=2829795 RepID=A0A916NJ85_9FLAO|nr:bifunctional molybdenum cofactor biosynthesis protein MoaC/MoaB [Parvicella tangerina]CAG5086467.1 Cyclic pyranopterin monophosphate synthase [Parvicella tangerina]